MNGALLSRGVHEGVHKLKRKSVFGKTGRSTRIKVGTPCTPCKCATRLRHAPTICFFRPAIGASGVALARGVMIPRITGDCRLGRQPCSSKGLSLTAARIYALRLFRPASWSGRDRRTY